jgi:hypothetical protein
LMIFLLFIGNAQVGARHLYLFFKIQDPYSYN